MCFHSSSFSNPLFNPLHPGQKNIPLYLSGSTADVIDRAVHQGIPRLATILGGLCTKNIEHINCNLYKGFIGSLTPTAFL